MQLLLAGQNMVLPAGMLNLELSYPARPGFTSAIDVCAFMLNTAGKVGRDDEFIFYNNPASTEGAVVLESAGFSARVKLRLADIPAHITKVALTVVIDGMNALEGLQHLILSVPGVANFTVDTVGRQEKAFIVGEVYRHNQQWKLRALGQGFNGGLEPLARHYGVDVSSAPPAPVPVTTVSLEKKIADKAPRLVSLAKNATVSLVKHHLQSVKARVAFVLDASGSMKGQFSKGNVQAVLESIAVLAVQFDDDGAMDVWGFGQKHKKYPDVTLDNLDGYIASIQKGGAKSGWENLPGLGGTNNEPPVMQEITEFFRTSDLPVYVVFITDGGISKTREIKEVIRLSANYPIFWKFVGLGGRNYGILEELDNFTDRRLDNTHFFPIDNFASLKSDQLYDLLLAEFKTWYDAVKQ